ncbi:MAG: class I SAM-dependent methyltransferase, partial [Pseudomonadota bacterium]
CSDCGLFYTNPMPTNEELADYYAAVYRAEYQFAFRGPRKTHINKKNREALRRGDRIASLLGNGRTLKTLDFGCGSGELVRHLASLGHAAEGFEPGVTYSTHASDHVLHGTDDKSVESEQTGTVVATPTIHAGTWHEMTFASDRFDLITFLHVLEHLNEPVAALKRVKEWLSPNGVLYVETPDMQGYQYKGFERFHFAHVLGFSRANLMLAAKTAGFGLLHEDGPTSFFLVHREDPRAKAFEFDLQKTVDENRSEYGAQTDLAAYLSYHWGRVGRMVKTELKQGR